MAYDGHSGYDPYRTGNMNPDPNDPHAYYSPAPTPTPPYPSHYPAEHLNMSQSQPQPQMTPTAGPAPNTAYPEPPPPPPPPRVPPQHTSRINDAVNSAINQTDTYLSPEVLSQITATVIQQLKASGLENLQASGPPPQRLHTQQPPWPPAEPNSIYTHSGSPHSMPSQPNSSIPSNLPPSFVDAQAPYAASGYGSDTRPAPKPSQEGVADRDNPSPNHSQSSEHSQKTETRPRPPSRDATVTEMTTLEKIWGKLFEDGKPTKRLGQFLRGIAVHLIEDYPPGNTIVIVPEKLQKFYKDTHVSWDSYPWQDIFDDRTSSISRLFRAVEAEHHLVQNNMDERPDIPGLTPRGFEKWATLMIQANPEREFERLQKAVLNMPINNPDDKKERFPKEIPRRLFPEVADLRLREDTEEHIMKHCGVDLPHITDEERAQAASHRPQKPPNPASARMERTASYERGRPHGSASSAVIDDDDETISPAPIERERKPYSAQPGGGKMYEEPGTTRSRTDSFSTTNRPDIPSSSAKSSRPTSDIYDQTPLYARSGPNPAGAHHLSSRYGRSRSSSGSVNRPSDYRHSESDLLTRDREYIPRYGGVSTGDLYVESPPSSSIPADTDGSRRYREHLPHRGSRASEEEYYRGMLGGQGGGPVHEYYYR